MSNRKDQHFIVPHRSTEMFEDAEKVRQLRSHLESILNVAQRLRLRCFLRLRPC